jgi:hypothetical protein
MVVFCHLQIQLFAVEKASEGYNIHAVYSMVIGEWHRVFILRFCLGAGGLFKIALD